MGYRMTSIDIQLKQDCHIGLTIGRVVSEE